MKKRFECRSRIFSFDANGHFFKERMVVGEDEMQGLDNREWEIEELPSDFSEDDYAELIEKLGQFFDRNNMSSEYLDVLVPESVAEIAKLTILILSGNHPVDLSTEWMRQMSLCRIAEFYETKPYLVWR